MKIQQFEDKFLAHYSYAILSECEQKIILIDPSRNPQQYYEYATLHGAQIIGVIETHSHADFVSSHLEIQQKTGAAIYASKMMEADFEISTFDEPSQLSFGKILLRPLNTPGHSLDSISIVLEHNGVVKAVFTGDTLFIGDCGRPDLRESQENPDQQREKLAGQMYHSLREKLMILPDDTIVYPAHGAGTLCGKALSEASSSTIGEEKKTNWSLQAMGEQEFIIELTADQPFIPVYFPYDVKLNKKGAVSFDESVQMVERMERISSTERAGWNTLCWVVDTRDQKEYKKSHLPHSVNIMNGNKFETWLGSIIKPDEVFYLASDSEENLEKLIGRTASIGYESKIEKACLFENADLVSPILDIEHFREHLDDYTIIDVRNAAEVLENKISSHSLNIPLAEIRERLGQIPKDKPVAVHCASGYRSAIGSSLIDSLFHHSLAVYDIGEVIKEFNKQTATH